MDAGELERISQEHHGWILTARDDGQVTARRDYGGSQQVFTVPALDELERYLKALPG